jgi:uncharacterized protein
MRNFPAMKCPHDDTALREVETGGFRVAGCRQCSGIWLTRDTLKQAIATRRPVDNLDPHEPPPPARPAPTRRRLCPGCHCQLAPRWLHGIEIDVCEKCHGLWLDAGELRQIIVNHRQGTLGPGFAPSGRKAVADQRDSNWADVLDVPFDLDFLSAVGNGLGDLASSGVEVAKPVVEFLGEALSLLDW